MPSSNQHGNDRRQPLDLVAIGADSADPWLAHTAAARDQRPLQRYRGEWLGVVARVPGHPASEPLGVGFLRRSAAKHELGECEVHVDASRRGEGITGRISEALVAMAKRAGLKSIRMESDPDDRDFSEFYERLTTRPSHRIENDRLVVDFPVAALVDPVAPRPHRPPIQESNASA